LGIETEAEEEEAKNLQEGKVGQSQYNKAGIFINNINMSKIQ